jgi:glycosyltransferase involved in cell wall biosynthesis
MKILNILSNPDIGGTETLLLDTILHIESLGCKMEILNTWRGSTMKNYAFLSNVSYKELSGSSRYVNPRDIYEIVHIIRQGNYDLIQVFGLRVSLLMRFLKPFFRKIPLVIGLHGINLWHRWYHKWPDYMTQGFCDIFVSISDAVKESHVKRGKLSQNKIVVIPNGTDLDKFHKARFKDIGKKTLGLPDDKIIITTIANIRHAKGHDFYVKVIEKFFKRLEDIQFVWTGEGLLKSTITHKIKELGISDKITMLGRVNDVRPILANSDIFVLPSREEGMPRALMEAMSMSLPCVATDVGGVREVVEEEVSGFISDFGDVECFGENILKLVEDKDLRMTMGYAARQRIARKFDIQEIAKKYITLFRLAIAGERDAKEIQKKING